MKRIFLILLLINSMITIINPYKLDATVVYRNLMTHLIFIGLVILLFIIEYLYYNRYLNKSTITKNMKKIIYFISKHSVYARAKHISFIAKHRLNRINKAIDYINHWSDIPTSWLAQSVCDILEISYNKNNAQIVTYLSMPNVDRVAFAKLLPYKKQSNEKK